MPMPLPDREEERLQALDRFKVLDTAPEEAFDRITRLAASALAMPIALVSLVDRDRQWFKSRHRLAAEQTPREVAFCAHAICGEEVFVVPDAEKDPRFSGNPLVTDDPNVRFYAGAPLRTSDGHNLGTLCVIDHQPRELSESQQKLLSDLAAMVVNEFEIRLAGRSAVEALLESTTQARELSTLARTNSLTGALNRRGFLELAEREFSRATRYRRPLSLLMLDVDRFKRINDGYGHATGDAVLKRLVKVATATIRAEDVFARLGGEEFAILVPETTAHDAQVLANRLKAALASASVDCGAASVRFTVSIGVAECDCAGETIEEALARADTALYAAKKAGRNRVRIQAAA